MIVWWGNSGSSGGWHREMLGNAGKRKAEHAELWMRTCG